MRISMPKIILSLLLAGSFLLGGCANTSSQVYSRDQTLRERTVQFGVVDSVREVALEGSRSGVGTLAGSALGGIAGSNIGHGRGAIAGAILGAVLGGLAGHALEDQATQSKGQEITVRLESGRLISVVQDAAENLLPGERVRVLTGQGETRVTRQGSSATP